MKFPLFQLHLFNRTKPILEVEGIDGELQWDKCDLSGLPPERENITFTDQGKIPKGQWDNLPETFKAINGGEYFIKYIIALH
jgi:hypothetical protein